MNHEQDIIYEQIKAVKRHNTIITILLGIIIALVSVIFVTLLVSNQIVIQGKGIPIVLGVAIVSGITGVSIILLSVIIIIKDKLFDKPSVKMRDEDIPKFTISLSRYFKINAEHEYDALDELLIKKGKDPQKIMSNLEDERAYGEDEHVMNRIKDRWDKQKKEAERAAKDAHRY